MCRIFSCVVGRGCLLSWQNSISLCPASFCTIRPNLPVTPGISWLTTSAFQSPIMRWHFFDALKVLHSICHEIWKTQQWPQDWKRSVFIPIPKKDNDKECSNYRTIALISHAGKVMLKILQVRLQQYVLYEHPDVQAGFRKGRGTRDQIVNIH